MTKKRWITGQKPYKQLLNEASALGPTSIVKQMVVCDFIDKGETAGYDNEWSELFYLNYLNYQRPSQATNPSSKAIASRHQPRGFFELSQRYSNYEVLYTKIELWYNMFSQSTNSVLFYTNTQPIHMMWIPSKFEDGAPAIDNKFVFPSIKVAAFENVGVKDLGNIYPIPGIAGGATTNEHNEYRAGVSGVPLVSNRMGASNQKMNYTSIQFKPTDIAPNMSSVERKVTNLETEPSTAPGYHKGGFQPVGVTLAALSIGDALGEGTGADDSAFDNKLQMIGYYRITYKVRWSGRQIVNVSNIG